MQKREKQLKNIGMTPPSVFSSLTVWQMADSFLNLDLCLLPLGLLKRKKPSYVEHTVKAARSKASKPQLRFLLQQNFLYVDSLLVWQSDAMIRSLELYQWHWIIYLFFLFLRVDLTQRWLILGPQLIG